MKKLGILLAATAIVTFTSCKDDKKNLANPNDMNDSINMDAPDIEKEPSRTLSIVMEAKGGSASKGEAVFIQERGIVRMEAKFSGLKEGKHAIHLHETADCSSEDGMSSGGHWNPTKEKHGKWGDSEGYHKGDIGNFDVDSDGNGTVIFETDQWCIGCGDNNKDILGTALIVHEGTDDYVSQPTGNAGGRVSCGEVTE